MWSLVGDLLVENALWVDRMSKFTTAPNSLWEEITSAPPEIRDADVISSHNQWVQW